MTNTLPRKTPLIVSALRGEKTDRIPLWLMRQAGRYLPEYRALRAQAGGFLAMAYNPAHASEITLQPIHRYGLDAAIIFSDILVIPHALGQDLRFEAGEGPRLGALDIDALQAGGIDRTLNAVYQALEQTREKLDAENFGETGLIGFCGAPWTVACYMIEGHGSPDFAKARNFAKDHTDQFAALMDILHAASLHYLLRQADSGAQALQIFDSWAGLAGEAEFDRWIIAPTQKLVRALKATRPDVPVIGFPRGVSLDRLRRYAQETGIDGLGCDYIHDPAALASLQGDVCVQGNLDPALLLEGGAAMDKAAMTILDALAGGPFIFNLGHGVIKETPPEHVARLVKLVQEYRA